MSGYGSLRKRTHEAAEPVHDDSRCWANDCPCRGSVSHEGGHFVCTAHSAVPSDRWPMISERLREFSWLVNFVDEMAKMDRKGQDWRGFANQFWSDADSACRPDAREGAPPYQLRMRNELLYRCGLMKRRPLPRIPEPVKSRGNAGRLFQRGAA